MKGLLKQNGENPEMTSDTSLDVIFSNCSMHRQPGYETSSIHFPGRPSHNDLL